MFEIICRDVNYSTNMNQMKSDNLHNLNLNSKISNLKNMNMNILTIL